MKQTDSFERQILKASRTTSLDFSKRRNLTPRSSTNNFTASRIRVLLLIRQMVQASRLLSISAMVKNKSQGLCQERRKDESLRWRDKNLEMLLLATFRDLGRHMREWKNLKHSRQSWPRIKSSSCNATRTKDNKKCKIKSRQSRCHSSHERLRSTMATVTRCQTMVKVLLMRLRTYATRNMIALFQKSGSTPGKATSEVSKESDFSQKLDIYFWVQVTMATARFGM